MESSSTEAKGRSSSPTGERPVSPHSSASSSSTSSVITGTMMNVARPSSSSASSVRNIGEGLESRSVNLNRSQSELIDIGLRGYNGQVQSGMGSGELLSEGIDVPRAGDSISVTIRFRPLSDREFQRGDEVCWYPDGDKIVRNEYNTATAYAFDKVFGPDTNTPEVYEVAAKPVVKAAMDGVTGTVFAYGVTSSGKTHTMHGDHYSPGIIPLAIKDVFSIIQETPGREFLLRVSYLEIYNEVINDLLDPTGQNLRVREDAQGTYVEGIKEEVVLSPGHALSFIAAGEEHRHVGSNNFNLLSSRSHTIFTLMIESSATGEEYDGVVFSQLNLIDLAGSESSKTETTGLRRKEGSYINKSLLTLGTVIGKLSEGRATHVPYRDSKLTRLLQSSLSGHGHVSLICTITPASSNLEETHNTLKFASRAKRIEIFASRNMIIDEKSLIKKYQREIASLKQEMEQLKRGILVGVNHEQLLTLKQQLEQGQVKMQSRLEEEEDAKAALMSRIQRLTKLILISSKNTVPLPTRPNDLPAHSQSSTAKEDGGSLTIESDMGENPPSPIEQFSDPSQATSFGNCNEEASPVNTTVMESLPTDDVFNDLDFPEGEVTMADKVDLYVEQVKLLTEDIALSSSTLKRMVEQSANNPDSLKVQIQNLEAEIEEKKNRVKALEQLINESGEASVVKASLVEMQQIITRLTAQCDEKSFELELRTADNYILQEQLHDKGLEIKELQEKVNTLQQQLVYVVDKFKSQSDDLVSAQDLNEVKRKLQLKVNENEKMRLERIQYVEENSGLHVQNQKLAEEASYAKELASAAAVELKNLAAEVTKLSLKNAKLEKEIVASQTVDIQSANGFNRRHNENTKPGEKGRLSNRAYDFTENESDDFDLWNLDQDDLIIELQARKQKEKNLQATLAEKELLETEYRKKVEDSKKREKTLEGDLANMWVLVAKLKKEAAVAMPQDTNSVRNPDGSSQLNISKSNDSMDSSMREKDIMVVPKPVQNHFPDEPKEESLIDRLKARMQEMKAKELKAQANVDIKEVKSLGNAEVAEKELKTNPIIDTKDKEFKTYGNGNMNSHLCKVCFESPTAAILLPCRHFCLCKSCSLACSECPICRSKISDRLFAFS